MPVYLSETNIVWAFQELCLGLPAVDGCGQLALVRAKFSRIWTTRLFS